MLDETGADGFIPMRLIGQERFRYEEALHSIIGETTGGVYRLGQAVRVRLAEATPLTGGLRFDMLSDPLPGGPKRKGKKQGQGGRFKTKSGSKSAKRPGKKKRRGKANAKPRRD